MSFRPYPTNSGFVALAVTIIFGSVTLFLINTLLQQSEPSQIFKYIIWVLVALAATGITLYWTVVAFKLTYDLNRNGVAIQWGLSRQQIPFKAIANIIPGENVTASPNFKGVNLAGLRVGRGSLADYGLLKFKTTAALDQSLLVITTGESYVISPRQPSAFIKAWQARRELGPTQQWATGVQHQWPLNTTLLRDPLTWWLLGISTLLCLALFGYISLQYADLPQALPVHFNSLGRADRIAGKAVLFALPAAGALVWLVNGTLGMLVYRWEKMGAYLLWGSSIAMQFCLWVAALTIISA